MQDVVLVDAPVDGAADGAAPLPRPPRPARGSPRARGWRRWWKVAAGTAAVATAATVVSSAVADEREGSRLAALAVVPGILAPIDGPVAELWRRDLSLWPGLTEVADRLIGVEARADGSVDVVALDPLTGDAAWRLATRPRGEFDLGTTCTRPGPPTSAPDLEAVAASPEILVCVVVDATAVTGATTGSDYRPTSARLVVLDANAGTQLSGARTAPSTAVAAIGGDLVISRIDDHSRLEVTRTNGRGLATRWRYAAPTPLPAGTDGLVASVAVTDDLILVSVAGSGWVFSGDGKLLRSWTADFSAAPTASPSAPIVVLPRGRLLVGPTTGNGSDAGASILTPSTGRSFAAAGTPVAAVPDDGSLPDLLLMESAEDHDLVAYDVATGLPRWTAEGSASGGVAIFDGRVLRAGTTELRSIDGRTGDTVWATPVLEAAEKSLTSDGRVALVTQHDAARGTFLGAYGLGDGGLRWEADLPDDLYLLAAFGGRLFGWGDQLIALG